jgi:hypothetical protein
LRELPGRSLEGDRIAREYRLGTHFAATVMVAQIQEELDHHADHGLIHVDETRFTGHGQGRSCPHTAEDVRR